MSYIKVQVNKWQFLVYIAFLESVPTFMEMGFVLPNQILSQHICRHLKWLWVSVLTLRNPSEMLLNVFKLATK